MASIRRSFRDDGFTQTARAGWSSLEEFFESFWRQAKWFTLDRQQGQARRIMLWCEATGMVPQLEKVADEFSVQVCSSGGFDSVTAKHTLGRALADEGPLEVLHLGDHDPSGAHMFLSLEEDRGVRRTLRRGYVRPCPAARKRRALARGERLQEVSTTELKPRATTPWCGCRGGDVVHARTSPRVSACPRLGDVFIWRPGHKDPITGVTVTAKGDVWGVTIRLKHAAGTESIFFTLPEARQLPWIVHRAVMDAIAADARDKEEAAS